MQPVPIHTPLSTKLMLDWNLFSPACKVVTAWSLGPSGSHINSSIPKAFFRVQLAVIILSVIAINEQDSCWTSPARGPNTWGNSIQWRCGNKSLPSSEKQPTISLVPRPALFFVLQFVLTIIHGSDRSKVTCIFNKLHLWWLWLNPAEFKTSIHELWTVSHGR